MKETIIGVCPAKSNSYIPNGNKLHKHADLKRYERNFFIQCRYYREKNIEGYFELLVDVYYPNQRFDVDNSLKIILDCLQSCRAIKNDNRCMRIVVQKFIDIENPRIEFVINETFELNAVS